MANIDHTRLHLDDGIGLPAQLGTQRLRGVLAGGWWQQSRYAARLPVHPPQPLVRGDAERGRAMLRGQFTLSGSTAASAPANLFSIDPPSEQWREALLTLAWLQDLAATPLQLAGLTARAALVVWQQQTMNRLSPRQAARALINLSAQADFLLRGAGGEFQATFFQIISKLCRRTEPGFIEGAETALLKGVALSHAAVAFQFPKSTRESTLTQVTKSLDKVVLPDGGHVSRSPSQLVQLALDLVPLQHALRASHLAVPAALNAALERLLPMLRLLLHGDGGLAAFHDGGLASRGDVQAVLAADASCGRPLALAPYAGFGRLAYHDGRLIMDTGSGGACGSTLACEFSDAGQRLIVSCGRPAEIRHAWHRALATPAAHSSWDMSGDLACLAPSLKSETVSSPQGGLLRASLLARGWRRKATHQRSVFLAASGDDLRGEDRVRIEGRVPQSCCLRFHLHPLLAAEPAPHPNCVSLALPDGRSWMFSQAGGSIAIEDSVYCDAGGSPQPSLQIVVRSAQADGLDVRWSLRRMSGRSPVAKAPA